ncbi:lipopolysaccharide biosynthesis protein [Aliikangiella sp. G2MR2-5]|uniref:lipopolysaccharide biosynthesis protein n=1 Tax=Aliikangiella sp. G2MR2-5 TaxID=2788943 RepID=UPI0018A8F28C|nr:lipopolysaccharide biosynthesis protein [Aliikangiella sp. G2MR2-5]
MSEQLDQVIEDEYTMLSNSASRQEWNNPKYILQLAQQFEKGNLPLAYRLMQRAHNLNPKGPVINKKLESYRGRLSIQEKHNLETKVSESSDKDNPNLKQKLVEHKLYKAVKALKPFTLCVIIPTIIFALYQALWASERYESTAQVFVKQPDSYSSMTPEMALLSGIGLSSGDNDSKLVETYIYSMDMLSYLEEQIKLREHYSNSSIDFFSRLHDWESKEDFLEYYLRHIEVLLVQDSTILEVRVQAYSSEFAHKLNKAIITRAEWFINSVSHDLAKEQIEFIGNEHKKWINNLKESQNRLLEYQQKYGLLDPSAEGMALQSIAYNLEGQIASKQAELIAAEKFMHHEAQEVITIKNQLFALQEQLKNERERLTMERGDGKAVSEVIAKFSDLKAEFELSMQAYTASLASLEKAKVEAYRQIKFLVIVEQPTLPEASAYPTVIYNVFLFLLVLSLSFGIVRLIWATVQELS